MSWKKKVGMPAQERNRHTIDVADRPLGRVATEVAKLLMGKHKPTYTPNIDGGDFVDIVNVAQIKLTGKKWEDMVHYKSSNRPGGIREVSVKKLRDTKPEEILIHCVRYMLPKNTHQVERMKRLTFKK